MIISEDRHIDIFMAITNGNGKIVKEFVTLTASVSHPLIRKQLVLATMNCKHEDSNNVAKFGEKFSKASRKVNQTKKMRMDNTYGLS